MLQEMLSKFVFQATVSGTKSSTRQRTCRKPPPLGNSRHLPNLLRVFVRHRYLATRAMSLAGEGESAKYKKGLLARKTYQSACCLKLLIRATIGRSEHIKHKSRGSSAPVAADFINSFGVSPREEKMPGIGQTVLSQRIVLQSQFRESLAVATKGCRVETISRAFEDK